MTRLPPGEPLLPEVDVKNTTVITLDSSDDETPT